MSGASDQRGALDQRVAKVQRDPICIVVVSPILAIRTGLRVLLSSIPMGGGKTPADKKKEVIWEAASLAEIEALPLETDILLVTAEAVIETELWRLLRRDEGRLALLLLVGNAHEMQELGRQRLPIRAWGILGLDASAEELEAAVYALHQGLLVGTPSLLAPRLNQLISAEGESLEPLAEPLTTREAEVLQLLAQGLANKQIAAALSISDHTVKFHISSIYTKLGATSRTEAARLGAKRGLVTL